MGAPRGLSEDEAAAWARLAETVTPFKGRSPAKPIIKLPENPKTPRVQTAKPSAAGKVARPAPAPARPAQRSSGGLDSHWDRRLSSGSIEPDFTLDLHGHGLDAAHSRLMRGMAQARAMGARTVLVIAGKPRPVDPADRGERRGAIRAKLLDWLAASEHGEAIAAIRKAHRQHGGEGALYVVLRRGR